MAAGFGPLEFIIKAAMDNLGLGTRRKQHIEWRGSLSTVPFLSGFLSVITVMCGHVLTPDTCLLEPTKTTFKILSGKGGGDDGRI